MKDTYNKILADLLAHKKTFDETTVELIKLDSLRIIHIKVCCKKEVSVLKDKIEALEYELKEEPNE